ncbi:uncharacterized protein LOC123909447 [Trifolium pratense]|uniref:uncharacterized protein LOC123909447 n=1 Tax=Trifolium pratense TaxID=57577 RepID=UPI001E692468|nr:uncharacterized protein LOC123909447 [Trifolium pratense]XP_045816245.1 uncharacterized protein LOC123909447 [Trifolium pratense]XP_045816246.1 uncharacterized protein LOC123909447 [Trifolium pratense]
MNRLIFRDRDSKSQNCCRKRPTFSGVENLDDNTKVSALKASSFVVSLVSFSGASILSPNCGAIIERDGWDFDVIVNTPCLASSFDMVLLSANFANFYFNRLYISLKAFFAVASVVISLATSWASASITTSSVAQACFCVEAICNLACISGSYMESEQEVVV